MEKSEKVCYTIHSKIALKPNLQSYDYFKGDSDII